MFLALAATLSPLAAFAAEAPLAGSPFFFQTSGAATALTVGDWYTASGGGNGYHYYTINIPCPGNTTFPIHVDIFSPELHGAPGATLDEIRDTAAAATTNVAFASNTQFEIYAAGTAVAPFATPAPGTSTLPNLPLPRQQTYTPVTTNDEWVRFYTIPAGSACGAYVLRAETVGATANDDNSWRLRVSGDDDANPVTTPPTNLDPGITIGQIYGSMQHNGAGTQCISTYELLGAGPATFNNFDMDGGTSVTYNPPRNGGPIAGTLSGNGVWNVGTGSDPAPRDGDLVTVAANQTGYWRIDTCLPANNQFIQEGGTPFPGLFSLPLSMTLTKTDGVTTAQMGGLLQYTLTFTNTSVPTSGVAKGVTIVDTIPVNSTFDSASVSAPFTGTCTFSAGAVTCPVNENVPAGASGTVLVWVVVNDPAAGSTVVNNATLDFTDVLDAHFPLLTASDTDQLPALKLVKTSDCTAAVSTPGVCDTAQGPQVGDVIAYTVTLSNPSAARQTGLVMNDPLPAGTTYVANSTLATGTVAFLDQFTAAAYNLNDARPFLTSWVETGDDGTAGGGNIQVVGDLGDNSLRFNGGGGTANDSVERQANLVGCTSASLTYESRRVGLDNNEDILVEADADGAGAYALLATILGVSGGGGVTDAAYVPSATLTIPFAQISNATRIRFRSAGFSGGGEFAFFDNIRIQAACAIDNIAGGVRPDLASGVPSTLVTAADGFVLDPSVSMTVTFRVTVTAAGAIANIATATSTQDTDPAQGSVRDVALTQASLAGLRISGGLVEFATSWQRGTAGFNLYSADTRLRRAPRVRINGALIPSPRPVSMTPTLYQVEAQVTGPYLWVEEVEVGSDAGRMMGPFAVDDENLRRQFERMEWRMQSQPQETRGGARSLRRGPGGPGRPRVGSPSRGPARAGAFGVKIETSRAGRVTTPWNDLIALGLPARFAASPARLQLTSEGLPVPFTTSARGLHFVARDLSTDYAAHSVYVVTWNGAPTMPRALARSEPLVAPGFTRIQKNLGFYGAVPAGSDPWLWDFVVSGDSWPADWDPTQGDFDLPGYSAGAGQVTVRIALLGATFGEHAIAASINGVRVGELTFTGFTLATLEGSIPASVLLASGNRLTLVDSSPGEPGTGYVALNFMDLGLSLPVPEGAVARIASYDATLPRLSRADYLIVTHADFEAQAERIASLRESSGRNVAVVDVERAYDRFTGGIPDASAVQALIAVATRASAVLLIGDDTIDPPTTTASERRCSCPRPTASMSTPAGWPRRTSMPIAMMMVLLISPSDVWPSAPSPRPRPRRTRSNSARACWPAMPAATSSPSTIRESTISVSARRVAALNSSWAGPQPLSISPSARNRRGGRCCRR